MRNIILLLTIITCYPSFSQTMEKEMEKKAREFHRVIGLSDKDQWKKFIQENYAKSLIEKSMKQKVSRQGDEGNSSETTATKGTLEDKVQMFERLHEDFGGSKIVSIKTTGENLDMVLDGGNLLGTFKFKFDKTSPYLITGFGINAEGGGR